MFSYTAKELGSAVCKVSPTIRTHLCERQSRIRVGMRSCPIRDRFHLRQCGRCLKFGHKTASCRNETHIALCAFCAESHETKSCPQKQNPDNHRCANCRNNPNSDTVTNDIYHNAYSDKCPIHQENKAKLIQATDWGNGPQPSM